MKSQDMMAVYNLFPLLAGPFSKWKEHLTRASDMGFNWVFVNPIQRPGVSGSLYSVSDYFRFNPLLIDPGEDEKWAGKQVREVIGQAEEMGLRMMVDLVVNHCAVDSELIQEHPEWFLWEEKGSVAHPSCRENGETTVWKDLAKFDHRHSSDKEGMYQFFLRVVKCLLELGFSGFRCDAAYQVPVSFWKRLIKETKATHPDVLFVAETLGCTADQTRKTAGAGFDYIFNSSKWWDFHSHWLLEQYILTREIVPSIGFPESHDTVRLCEEFQGNIDGLKQRYLFSALFSSGVMIPMGFEFGFRRKPHVVDSRPEDWEETDVDLTEFIKKVNLMKQQHTLLHEEAPTEIFKNGNSNVLIMWKGSLHSQEESLLILNKDIHNSQHFHVERLQEFVQAGAPLVDVSPEYPLDFVPEPFSYDLRPGQGIVLLTTRDPAPED